MSCSIQGNYMRGVVIQLVQYLLEEGLCVDVVLLVDVGHGTLDLVYQLVGSYRAVDFHTFNVPEFSLSMKTASMLAPQSPSQPAIWS